MKAMENWKVELAGETLVEAKIQRDFTGRFTSTTCYSNDTT